LGGNGEKKKKGVQLFSVEITFQGVRGSTIFRGRKSKKVKETGGGKKQQGKRKHRGDGKLAGVQYSPQTTPWKKPGRSGRGPAAAVLPAGTNKMALGRKFRVLVGDLQKSIKKQGKSREGLEKHRTAPDQDGASQNFENAWGG